MAEADLQPDWANTQDSSTHWTNVSVRLKISHNTRGIQQILRCDQQTARQHRLTNILSLALQQKKPFVVATAMMTFKHFFVQISYSLL